MKWLTGCLALPYSFSASTIKTSGPLIAILIFCCCYLLNGASIQASELHLTTGNVEAHDAHTAEKQSQSVNNDLPSRQISKDFENIFVSKLIERLSLIDPLADRLVPPVTSLYNAFNDLVIPIKAGFELGVISAQQSIISKFLDTLSSAVSLGELRSRASRSEIILDTSLSSIAFSGPNCMNVFPVYTLDEKTGSKLVREYRLNHLQYCGILSYALKQLHIKYSQSAEAPTDDDVRYNDKCFSMLLGVAVAYWSSVRWGGWSADYHPSMKVRTQRILGITPYHFPNNHAYYKVFLDFDDFVLQISADLLFVINNGATRLNVNISESDLAVLKEIRDFTYRIMEYRLSPHFGCGFVLESGMRRDHPDYIYAGYYGGEYPDPKTHPPYKLDNVAQDISHSFRWPLWLESFRDSWLNDMDKRSSFMRKYYDSLRIRLANQITTYVLTYTSNGVPLGTNYIDGNNGWYRVNYVNSGNYRPFGLSIALPTGTYYLLGPCDSRIKAMGRAYGAVMASTDRGVVATRTQYYGPTFTTSHYLYLIYQLALKLGLI